MPPTAKTLGGLFWDTVRSHPKQPAQGWHEGGKWQERTYAEFGAAVRNVANGLLELGVRKGDRVGLWSRNSPQWAEVDFANLTAGFVTVPVYDTLTGEKAAHILRDSECRVVFVQDASLLERLAPHRAALKGLRHVVLMKGTANGAIGYDELMARAKAFETKERGRLDAMAAAVTPDDLASLVYTSGTTGDPKGAMLTHGNFASNTVTAVGCVEIGPQDVFLSFLPLSHVFERTGGHFAPYSVGAKVVFARSIEQLVEDLGTVHPTLMMSVPRLYEKMHARILATVASSSWLKRRIFHWAIAVGQEANRHHQDGTPMPKALQSRLKRADRLVFHKLKARVGGRLRYFVSGGAALSKEIESFFWAAGIPVLQGYGLTETSPVTNVNRPGALRLGSVGKAIPGVTVKIDPEGWEGTGKAHSEGEICVKGPNVMKGYWRNEKATREVFDAQGFFRTGDVGYIDGDGFLFITDRKKEIIVMSNGKKVAPQAIEGALKLQPHIAQAMVVGDDRNYIAALVVPEWPALEEFALANGIPATDRARLVADPRVVSLYEQEVEAVNARLSRYEQVKKFWVVPHEWSVESGELTPTLKLRRKLIQDRFRDAVARLYAKPDLVA